MLAERPLLVRIIQFYICPDFCLLYYSHIMEKSSVLSRMYELSLVETALEEHVAAVAGQFFFLLIHSFPLHTLGNEAEAEGGEFPHIHTHFFLGNDWLWTREADSLQTRRQTQELLREGREQSKIPGTRTNIVLSLVHAVQPPVYVTVNEKKTTTQVRANPQVWLYSEINTKTGPSYARK